jgi:hypothetical protein
LVYPENGKILYEISNWIGNFSAQTFEDSQQENLLEFLYPEKLRNLNQRLVNIVFSVYGYTFFTRKVLSKFNWFIQMLVERMNIMVNFKEVVKNYRTFDEYLEREDKEVLDLARNQQLDLYLQSLYHRGDLETYFTEDYCFLVPLPKAYSIYELVLILPFDISVWICLVAIVAALTAVWWLYNFLKHSRSSGSVLFGTFALFVGQSANVRT